ncbi:hypothetical protein HYH03_001618 [Edaphochlamys debaryana]|uniref:Methyltransferase domain-containing protein n=1 Tax=Edaphochlamys debaryana TaxID=47281 RepID=A0A835YFN2_9CHLO|nr:hypothetical protein HYH03_001618 [Edaphochlamys debaryana]|eukprot:KAG2500857.1 hypothetical protein HYH03_001618 [Edaphochlamys debaryana]
MFVRINEFLEANYNDNHPKAHRLFEPFWTGGNTTYAPGHAAGVWCPASQDRIQLTPSTNHFSPASVVCNLTQLNGAAGPCVVVNIASNNSAEFDRAVLGHTPCDVDTSDCTAGDGWQAQDPSRHTLWRYCVGSPEAAPSDPAKYRTLSQALELVGAGPGGPGSQRLPLLRLAVDAWEYAALAQWREDTPGLPEQIIVQLHSRANAGQETADQRWGRFEYGVTDLALFFMHMANLGYAATYRWNLVPTDRTDSVAVRGGWSEVSLVRVEVPAAGAHPHHARPKGGKAPGATAAAPHSGHVGGSGGIQHVVPIRVLLGNDSWHVQAARNLSDWRSSLFLRANEFLQQWRNDELPYGHHRFDLFGPIVECPPGRPLQLLGDGKDGSKLVCGVLEPGAREPCTILSLGSNNNVRFEKAVLASTHCDVATFDCTVDDPVIVDEQRHRFFKLCVGSSKHAAQKPDLVVSWKQILDLVGISRTPLLKIDVEAYEYPLFGEWAEDTPGLPEQIAVEVHGRAFYLVEETDWTPRWHRPEYGVTDLALFFMHMANLGYATTAQAATPGWGYLSEFTLMRLEGRAGHGKVAHEAAPSQAGTDRTGERAARGAEVGLRSGTRRRRLRGP